jgi:hypothetical protein
MSSIGPSIQLVGKKGADTSLNEKKITQAELLLQNTDQNARATEVIHISADTKVPPIKQAQIAVEKNLFDENLASVPKVKKTVKRIKQKNIFVPAKTHEKKQVIESAPDRLLEFQNHLPPEIVQVQDLLQNFLVPLARDVNKLLLTTQSTHEIVSNTNATQTVPVGGHAQTTGQISASPAQFGQTSHSWEEEQHQAKLLERKLGKRDHIEFTEVDRSSKPKKKNNWNSSILF